MRWTPDVNYRDYSRNGEQDYAELYGEAKSLNVLAFGEYTFDTEMNLTPFFELGYVEHEYANRGDEAQLFPDIPALNPFNLCNPDAVGGVDCGLANDAMLNNPHYIPVHRRRRSGSCSGPMESGRWRPR